MIMTRGTMLSSPSGAMGKSIQRQRSPLTTEQPSTFRTAASKAKEENLRALNTWGPLLLGVVFTTAGFYGVLVAIPALYHDDVCTQVMQAIAYFSFIELCAHWYLTRSTSPPFYDGCLSGNNAKINQSEENSMLTSVFTQQATQVQRPFGRGVQDLDKNRNTQYQYSNGNTKEATQQKCGPPQGVSRGLCLLNGISGLWSTITNGSRRALTPHQSKKVHELVWSYCPACAHSRPPRCHHCSVCRRCVLKRHHHCFFTGVCIGADNQRHFLAFMFWATFVTLFGTAHMFPYAIGCLVGSGRAGYSDFFPAIALYHAVLGQTDPIMFVLAVTFWTVCAFTVIAVLFFVRIVHLTLLGVTDTEFANNVKLADTRCLPQRLRHVMGEYWALNFILPYRRRTRHREDAINWPYTKGLS